MLPDSVVVNPITVSKHKIIWFGIPVFGIYQLSDFIKFQ